MAQVAEHGLGAVPAQVGGAAHGREARPGAGQQPRPPHPHQQPRAHSRPEVIRHRQPSSAISLFLVFINL